MSDINDSRQLYNMLKPEYRRLRNLLIINAIKTHLKTYYKQYLTSLVLGIGSYIIINIFVADYIAKHPKEIVYLKDKSITYLPDSLLTYDKFKHKIGHLESRNNYKIVNEYGYMGRYQIGKEALRAIGLGELSKNDFLQMSELQEIAFDMLMRLHKNNLAAYIGKYDGRHINGVLVTQSGILAAAHLGGEQSLKNYLDSNGAADFKDGNGTPISKYMRELGGFKIKFKS